MSLAQSPLSSTPTAAIGSYSYSNLNTNSTDDVLAFQGEYTPLVTISVSAPAPAPALSRSASCGYVHTTAASNQHQHRPQQLFAPLKLSRSQTTPTSIDSYFPSPTATNEYAQLTELWSAAREPTTHAVEPSDTLLDLFIPSTPTSTETFATYHPYDSVTIPQIARSTSDSSTCSTRSNVSSVSTGSTTSNNSNGVTKIKTSGKTKKCTYAARRREVSALRSETASLSKTLEMLQIQHQARASAELENTRLARAREENQRLRALVLSHELQLRATEGLLPDEASVGDDDDEDLAVSDDVLAAVAFAAAAEVSVN